MPNDRMNSIKEPKLYEDLRREGNSKEKSARISNAVAARGQKSVSKKGGEAGNYEDWTVPELRKRAKELGIKGYSGVQKAQLISKIRGS
jgi:Rho termination factor, N-terminal domain